MRDNWIQKCFDSIINSTVHADIIAIDNGSTDGSIDFIQKNYPQVDFFASGENLGFGKANNIGLRKALDNGGDYFLLLNQDAWVDSNTIEKLVEQSKISPEYGIISPLHLNGSGDKLDFSVAEHYLKPSSCPDLYSHALLNKVRDGIYDIEFINAAAWLLTKECLKRVGGFSPVFFHYGEDKNYCHRVVYKNLKIGIYPKVSICHDREERPKNEYFERLKQHNRVRQIFHSNPTAGDDTLENEIKLLKRHYLKIRFLPKSKEYKNEVRQKISFLEQQAKDILISKKQTKENTEYLFL